MKWKKLQVCGKRWASNENMTNIESNITHLTRSVLIRRKKYNFKTFFVYSRLIPLCKHPIGWNEKTTAIMMAKSKFYYFLSVMAVIFFMWTCKYDKCRAKITYQTRIVPSGSRKIEWKSDKNASQRNTLLSPSHSHSQAKWPHHANQSQLIQIGGETLSQFSIWYLSFTDLFKG